jgi:hypothetical protein
MTSPFFAHPSNQPDYLPTRNSNYAQTYPAEQNVNVRKMAQGCVYALLF